MAYAWQTIEEAAVTLGISVRTLHRRVGKGDLQTRLDNGRREVLVSLPDPQPQPADNALAPADNPQSPVSQPSSDLPATMADTSFAIAEDRIRRAEMAVSAFQHSITLANDETRRARSVAAVAWAMVGGLTAILIAATAYTTYRVTKASADTQHMTSELRRLADTSDRNAQELTRLREEAETARITAARAEGELRATRWSRHTTPATRPRFLERMADMLNGDK